MNLRPNILWLMSDQHHAGVMGCAGHPDARTPHLDRLAREGVMFRRAYCNNPICGPSRVSMLTGQYVGTTGVTGNELFEADLPNPGTLPTHLRAHGYQTAHVGKAHMLRAWDEAGFEHVRYCDLCDADRDDPRSCHYFDHLVRQGLADAYDHGYRAEGQTGHGVDPFVSDLPFEHNLERWTGDEAVAFLATRDTSRPFFLHVSFQRPHGPYAPSPEQAHDYDPASLTLPAGVDELFVDRFAGKPAFQRRHIEANHNSGYPRVAGDEADLRLNLAYYLTLVTAIDAEVGRILDHLRDTGQLDNTVVLYTADHGDFAGEHGLMHKNLGIYESIHRVPLLLHYPGGPAGVERDGLVELVDLYPTVCDLAGVPTPTRVEGASLRGVAEGRAAGKERAFCEWDFAFMPEHERVAAVRDDRFRLVRYDVLGDAEGELYDHENDPLERVNLWDDPTHRATRDRLSNDLARHRLHERRVWGLEEDRIAQERNRGRLTWQVHHAGRKWSDVAASVKRQRALADV